MENGLVAVREQVASNLNPSSVVQQITHKDFFFSLAQSIKKLNILLICFANLPLFFSSEIPTAGEHWYGKGSS